MICEGSGSIDTQPWERQNLGNNPATANNGLPTCLHQHASTAVVELYLRRARVVRIARVLSFHRKSQQSIAVEHKTSSTRAWSLATVKKPGTSTTPSFCLLCRVVDQQWDTSSASSSSNPPPTLPYPPHLPRNREPHNRVAQQLSVWSDHAGRDTGGVRRLHAGRAANSRPTSALMKPKRTRVVATADRVLLSFASDCSQPGPTIAIAEE